MGPSSEQLAESDSTTPRPKRKYNPKYYQAHREELARNNRKWEQSHPEAVARRIRRSNWKNAGMNPNEAEKLYNSKSTCDICNTPVAGKNKQVDHDHTTGKLRGVLCNNCNVLIGLARESPERLKQATEYLDKANRT